WTDKETWAWFPGTPGKSTKAVKFDLEPGQSVAAMHDKWPISANRARVWATSPSGKEWRDYLDQDLMLVQPDDRGFMSYVAAGPEPHTHQFVSERPVVTGSAKR